MRFVKRDLLARLGIVLGLVLSIGFGVLLSYSLYATWHPWLAFQDDGTTTQGVVLEKYDKVDDGARTHHIRYRFEYLPADGDPRPQTGKSQVSRQVYDQYVRNDQITVFYVANDPAISFLRPPTLLGVLAWTPLLSLGVFVFFWFPIYHVWTGRIS